MLGQQQKALAVALLGSQPHCLDHDFPPHVLERALLVRLLRGVSNRDAQKLGTFRVATVGRSEQRGAAEVGQQLGWSVSGARRGL